MFFCRTKILLRVNKRYFEIQHYWHLCVLSFFNIAIEGFSGLSPFCIFHLNVFIQGLNHFIFFLFPELKFNYESIKQDFKGSAINRHKFFLKHPSLGIALGERKTAYTIGHANRNIHALVFPDSPSDKVSFAYTSWFNS